MSAVVAWIVDSRYQDFLNNQQALAQQSLQSASNEITQHIHHRRQLAHLLVEENLHEIMVLAENATSKVAYNGLNRSVKRYFPEAFNFTLATMAGVPILDDPNRFVGRGCLADIKGFADGKHLNDIFIHSFESEPC